MSSFLCFICHNTINSFTTEDTREKYRELIGINLCPDSHLCHICRHLINKLWNFKSLCLKRSSEYPVLFSEEVAINLQTTDPINHIINPKSDSCQNEQEMYNFTSYHYSYDDHNNQDNDNIDNHYVDLQDDRMYEDCFDNPLFADYDLDMKPANHEQNETLNTQSHNHNEEIDNDNEVSHNHNEESHNNNEESYNHNEEENHNLGQNNEEDITNIKMEYVEPNDNKIVENVKLKDKKNNKSKSKKQKKTMLTIEQQKAVLDAMRKGKKYLEAEFKCYNCALGFLFKDTYQAHMMRHEESNGEYQCEVCTLRFACASLLRAHSRVHTQERKRKPKVDENALVPCHLCGRIFMDSTSLKQHLKRFHNQKNSNRTYSCSVCGKSYGNQRAVRTHMIKHINRKFDCDKCSSTFSSPYTLNQHKKKHDTTEATLYYCDTCNVSYNTRKSLLAHKRNTFAHQQTVFICPVCNKLCPTKRSLESHLSTVHASSKDYCCNMCECRYTNRKSLVRHMATHDANKKQEVFICYKCPKTFKSRSMLSKHLKKVCEKEKLVEENAYYSQENILTT